MSNILKLMKYEFRNVFRSKWIFFYTVFFMIVSYSLFSFGGNSSKAILSLMNVVIIIIPLVSIVFGTMYLYNSREYIETMLCQPIDRKSLFVSIYLSLAIPLSVSFAFGVLLPYIFFVNVDRMAGLLLLLVVIGIMLTFVFSALSFLIAVKYDDKVKGLGFAILLWLLLSVIYDGVVLFVVYLFQDYNLDKSVIALSILNPIDLSRILFLLKFNISALMGYTGAVFKKFFGESLGIVTSFTVIFIWILLPVYLAKQVFRRKDF